MTVRRQVLWAEVSTLLPFYCSSTLLLVDTPQFLFLKVYKKHDALAVFTFCEKHDCFCWLGDRAFIVNKNSTTSKVLTRQGQIHLFKIAIRRAPLGYQTILAPESSRTSKDVQVHATDALLSQTCDARDAALPPAANSDSACHRISLSSAPTRERIYMSFCLCLQKSLIQQ